MLPKKFKNDKHRADSNTDRKRDMKGERLEGGERGRCRQTQVAILLNGLMV